MRPSAPSTPLLFIDGFPSGKADLIAPDFRGLGVGEAGLLEQVVWRGVVGRLSRARS